MAVATGLDRPVLGNAGFLAEARQRVIFAEEGDDRSALAGFADHRGRNARDILRDAEALVLQFRGMFRDRPALGIADLGHAPDPVAERDQPVLGGVDVAPQRVTIVHCDLA